ncbi:FAD-dependent oxidoreductase [Actinoplanes couchii]|uniref:FAD-dependent oxidoreductase n=1 Tax=Actinoplanes couchii TaxID=403638 RepID=A0ABQ3XM51_9ACTN|nr:FAD-dependent monooxygenase [Actinoplanes couchii]MDR6319197.1 2-polyprenyl-6-methoxyphenol hydroxylase-like FAD-dependent oxidoreductase [Actinoplanes couchii]GID59592.1 FAD-dependent oxidoreductase [Actinoplanes couchii]
MPGVRTAIIIGGGIAGPVTALALRRAGIEATVHEAYPAGGGELGGTLTLAPNGVAALSHVGADEAVVARTTPITRQIMTAGDRRVELPALRGAPPLRVISRGDLHRTLGELTSAAGITVAYEKRMTGVRQGPAGVTAEFADGGTATADILIGADGVRSITRRLIDPQAPGPRYTGTLGFEAVASAEVGVEPGTLTFGFGRGAFYLYWPEPGGGTRWGVNLPWPRSLTVPEARAVGTARWAGILRDTFAADRPGHDLSSTTDPDGLQIAGAMQIMPPVPHWHRGRMVLVGDAAHAPSSTSGQGASLTVESAVQLARCLRDIADVPAAFATYERLRRGRVERIAARAARINQAKVPGPLARALMPVVMPALVKLMSPERTIGPDHRYTIDWASHAEHRGGGRGALAE